MVFKMSLTKVSTTFHTEAVPIILAFYQPVPFFYVDIMFRERGERNIFCCPCAIYCLLLQNIAAHCIKNVSKDGLKNDMLNIVYLYIV